jgi:hypothetical protein
MKIHEYMVHGSFFYSHFIGNTAAMIQMIPKITIFFLTYIENEKN